jgi:hypothetical protein
MSKLQYKHFSNISLLRRFNFDLLYQFLLPFKDYLCSKHHFQWTDNLSQFPYQELIPIFTVLDDEIPEMLHNGLFFINELSSPKAAETLITKLKKADLFPHQNLSQEDAALYTWLVAPSMLQELHSELAGFRLKKTESCFSIKSAYPDLSREKLIALEDDLNDWFDSLNKGRGVQVMVYERGDTIWFHLRHGELFRRDCALKNNGQTKRIVYRQERYDIIGYTPNDCEFEIHSDTKREKKLYCQLFGKHLFDNDNFIPCDNNITRYTLNPLITRGRDALTCSDIEGLDRICLTELQAKKPVRSKYTETYKSEKDLFNDWGTLDIKVNQTYLLIRASFQVYFTGIIDPKKLTICTPNVTILDRDTERTLIMNWLRRRGFIVT